MLIVGAGLDSVVSTDAARDYSYRLPGAEFELLADARHEILHERDQLRDMFWDAFDQFAEKIG